MQIVVVIPAYQPDAKLEELVLSLTTSLFEAIIIVDDGSGSAYERIFQNVGKSARVHVLRHNINLGKGAALKTGVHYVQANFPDAAGVLFADADGQHCADDIVAVARRFTSIPKCIVLGKREFHRRNPWKSRIGNRITRFLVHWLSGLRLSDTQTGLRAVPSFFFPTLLSIPLNGYDFELGVLIAAKHHQLGIVEQPIKTIYEPGNPSSHFNAVFDSLKILSVVLRFTAVSFITAILDILIFAVALRMGSPLLAAQVLARTAAYSLNYPLARKAVFLVGPAKGQLLASYVAVVCVFAAMSYSLIIFLMLRGFSDVVAKIAAEGTLFLFSFASQRELVFKR
jgi:glycosyltransferase involved in cell wall biosynthesis